MRMEEEFEEAQNQLAADASLVQGATDEQRRSLYGLNKQAKLGNCNMHVPEPKDFKSRWKYDAWMKFQGMSCEDAMLAFVVEMRKLLEQNGVKLSTSADKSSNDSDYPEFKNGKLSDVSLRKFHSEVSTNSSKKGSDN